MSDNIQENDMEGILSSIKNILEEDEKQQHTLQTPVVESSDDVLGDVLSSTDVDDVLELSPDMIVNNTDSQSDNNFFNETVDIPALSNIEENISIADITNDENLSDDVLGINNEEVIEEPLVLDEVITPDPVVEEVIEEPLVLDEVITPDPVVEEVIEEPLVLDEVITPDPVVEEVIEEPLVLDEVITPDPVVEEVIEEPLVLDEVITPDPVVEEVIEEPLVLDKVITPDPVVEEVIEEPLVLDEVITPDPVVEEKETQDISSNIMSNFAKMFSHEEKTETPNINYVGDTSKTLEQFVVEAIQKAIGNEILDKWNNGTDFSAYVEREIKQQVETWINDNMSGMIEDIVKKEVERIFAKLK